MSDSTAQFLRDVAQHTMTAIKDDGLHRHLWFGRPGTSCMHFALITWPGYLCYTGDMGTYVFRRLDDMLCFFRRGPKDQAFRIDMRYWAEKVEAADKCDGIDEFSAEKFKADVKDYFEQATSDSEEWPADDKAALWERIDDEVLRAVEDDGEHGALMALREFESRAGKRRFDFTDWERRSREYSTRFVWCCHALEWAVGVYDRSKASAEVAA